MNLPENLRSNRQGTYAKMLAPGLAYTQVYNREENGFVLEDVILKHSVNYRNEPVNAINVWERTYDDEGKLYGLKWKSRKFTGKKAGETLELDFTRLISTTRQLSQLLARQTSGRKYTTSQA